MEREKVFIMLLQSWWYLPSGLGLEKAVSSMLIEAVLVGGWAEPLTFRTTLDAFSLWISDLGFIFVHVDILFFPSNFALCVYIAALCSEHSLSD